MPWSAKRFHDLTIGFHLALTYTSGLAQSKAMDKCVLPNLP